VATNLVAKKTDKPASITTLESPLCHRVGRGRRIVADSKLHALCRTQDHIDAALVLGIPRLYLDFEDIRRYADAVKHIKDRSDTAQVWLATPRIQKVGRGGLLQAHPTRRAAWRAHSQSRSHVVLPGRRHPVTGDFSLNVANPLTAEILKKAGLERLTISYDLNIEQVVDLLASAPPSWFELTLHQHMPMFHMEHCAFAAFLSEGTDFTNCGRPCDRSIACICVTAWA
jgi:putative protease